MCQFYTLLMCFSANRGVSVLHTLLMCVFQLIEVRQFYTLCAFSARRGVAVLLSMCVFHAGEMC